jgi:hypothetical protein
MENNHHLNCLASICQCDTNLNYKNEVVWYPGEKVCQRTPYMKFQQKQVDINKWVEKGVFKNVDQGYTANELETRSI